MGRDDAGGGRGEGRRARSLIDGVSPRACPHQQLDVRVQVALMHAEGVELEVSDQAKRKIAQLATEINRDVDNIGARRLHTIVERLMEVCTHE